MPTLSIFYGIIIRMYYGDHRPPHFHAEYQGEEATFLLSGELLEGEVPPRARALVAEWARLRQLELRLNWERAERLDPVELIAPLE